MLNINSGHDVPAVMWYFFNKGDCGIIFIGKLLDNIWQLWQPIHMLPR
ncbi:hypothetical protein [Xylella fastidiosa]|nr:hypothetical protein [Xylella fastidiosa]